MAEQCIREPTFNYVSGIMRIYFEKLGTPDILKLALSYNTNLTLSSLNSHLDSVVRGSVGRYFATTSSVMHNDGNSQFDIMVHGTFNNIYAFDAVRDFQSVFERFEDCLQNVRELSRLYGAKVVSYPAASGKGKSLFMPHSILQWTVVGSADGFYNTVGNMNNNSSLSFTLSLIRRPDEEYLSDKQFETFSADILRCLGEESFLRLESGDEGYIYSHFTEMPNRDFLVFGGMISQYKENYIMDLTSKLKSLFVNSGIRGMVNLRADVKDNEIMIQTKKQLYVCDATKPVINDNFGRHYRKILS